MNGNWKPTGALRGTRGLFRAPVGPTRHTWPVVARRVVSQVPDGRRACWQPAQVGHAEASERNAI